MKHARAAGKARGAALAPSRARAPATRLAGSLAAVLAAFVALASTAPALSAPLSPAQTRPLPRVASFGLCADQMLLMLAARGQIASVSAEASGPLSAYAARARGIPVNRGAAEQIIAARVSVLLVSDAVDQRSAAALARFGVTVVSLPQAGTWPEIEAMTRQIARAIGRPARGDALVAQMRMRLAKVRPNTPRSTWPSVIYYRPDGGGAGKGSFVDLALSAAGFRNLQVEWGPPLWGGVPAERVVRTPPDLFAVSYFDTSRNASSILRRNPVLWGKARTRPVMPIHGKYWNCASPLLVDAVEQLASERRAFIQRTRR